MTNPTPAEFETISAASPLGPEMHYVNYRDERGPVRQGCFCDLGEEHDAFGRRMRFVWPASEYSEAWRWSLVLPAGTEAVNYPKPTMGASSE